MIEPAEVRCLISELRGGNGGICGVGLWAGNVMESLLREWEAARAVNRQFEERVAVLMSAREKEAQTADALIGLEKAARADLERAQAEAAAMRETLEALVGDVNALASESDGVSGLHLNGDLAPWAELLGGRYEAWIEYSMDRANAALSTSAGADLLAELARLREVERLAKKFKEQALPLENRNYHPRWYVAAGPLFAALDKETTPNG